MPAVAVMNSFLAGDDCGKGASVATFVFDPCFGRCDSAKQGSTYRTEFAREIVTHVMAAVERIVAHLSASQSFSTQVSYHLVGSSSVPVAPVAPGAAVLAEMSSALTDAVRLAKGTAVQVASAKKVAAAIVAASEVRRDASSNPHRVFLFSRLPDTLATMSSFIEAGELSCSDPPFSDLTQALDSQSGLSAAFDALSQSGGTLHWIDCAARRDANQAIFNCSVSNSIRKWVLSVQPSMSIMYLYGLLTDRSVIPFQTIATTFGVGESPAVDLGPPGHSRKRWEKVSVTSAEKECAVLRAEVSSNVAFVGLGHHYLVVRCILPVADMESSGLLPPPCETYELGLVRPEHATRSNEGGVDHVGLFSGLMIHLSRSQSGLIADLYLKDTKKDGAPVSLPSPEYSCFIRPVTPLSAVLTRLSSSHSELDKVVPPLAHSTLEGLSSDPSICPAKTLGDHSLRVFESFIGSVQRADVSCPAIADGVSPLAGISLEIRAAADRSNTSSLSALFEVWGGKASLGTRDPSGFCGVSAERMLGACQLSSSTSPGAQGAAYDWVVGKLRDRVMAPSPLPFCTATSFCSRPNSLASNMAGSIPPLGTSDVLQGEGGATFAPENTIQCDPSASHGASKCTSSIVVPAAYNVCTPPKIDQPVDEGPDDLRKDDPALRQISDRGGICFESPRMQDDKTRHPIDEPLGESNGNALFQEAGMRDRFQTLSFDSQIDVNPDLYDHGDSLSALADDLRMKIGDMESRDDSVLHEPVRDDELLVFFGLLSSLVQKAADPVCSADWEQLKEKRVPVRKSLQRIQRVCKARESILQGDMNANASNRELYAGLLHGCLQCVFELFRLHRAPTEGASSLTSATKSFHRLFGGIVQECQNLTTATPLAPRSGPAIVDLLFSHVFDVETVPEHMRSFVVDLWNLYDREPSVSCQTPQLDQSMVDCSPSRRPHVAPVPFATVPKAPPVPRAKKLSPRGNLAKRRKRAKIPLTTVRRAGGLDMSAAGISQDASRQLPLRVRKPNLKGREFFETQDDDPSSTPQRVDGLLVSEQHLAPAREGGDNWVSDACIFMSAEPSNAL